MLYAHFHSVFAMNFWETSVHRTSETQADRRGVGLLKFYFPVKVALEVNSIRGVAEVDKISCACEYQYGKNIFPMQT